MWPLAFALSAELRVFKSHQSSSVFFAPFRSGRTSSPMTTGLEDPFKSHHAAQFADSSAESSRAEGAVLSFGVIADVQYADRDDGWNFMRTRKRYYRGAMVKLKQAVDVWLRDEHLSFVLQLGDIIDGSNNEGQSELALRTVKKQIDRLASALPLGVLSSLGNHELYNFPKQRWAEELDCSSRAKAAVLRPSTRLGADGVEESSTVDTEVKDVATSGADQASSSKHTDCFYYSFCPTEAFRFIALDTYDVNAIDQPAAQSTGVKQQALHSSVTTMLAEKNPNDDKNNGDGIDGLGKRFVMYNGGIGADQLMWLESELQEAARARQRVIAFGHVPIHPADDHASSLVWNYDDVLRVMHKYDCVVLYLSGHRHVETFYKDEKGIPHLSLAAALEAPVDEEAFASVDVYMDHLLLRGRGAVKSRTIVF